MRLTKTGGTTKNLSVNTVDRQPDLAQPDHRGRDVIERNKAALKLFISHKEFAKAVEPDLTDLDHPAPRFPRGVAPLGLCLIATTNDIRNVAVRLDDLQRPSAAIPGVGAQMLAA